MTSFCSLIYNIYGIYKYKQGNYRKENENKQELECRIITIHRYLYMVVDKRKVIGKKIGRISVGERGDNVQYKNEQMHSL